MAEMLSSADNCNIYPLYHLREGSLTRDAEPNSTIDRMILTETQTSLGLMMVRHGTGDFLETLGPRDLFHWVYAIVHSRIYRSRYQDQLRADYPRVPLPERDLGFLRRLCSLGADLVALHLMESPKLDNHITTPMGSGEFRVEKVSYSDETVWIDSAKTRGFRGVPGGVWNFHIGGYQVCEKWLKDRQAKGGKNPRPGRTLTDEDIEHYQKIVVALHETIRLMQEIDEVIDQHGGWPDAFQAEAPTEELSPPASPTSRP